MRALRFAPYTIATLALTVALVALIGCATPAVLSAENVTPPHPGPAHTPPRDVYPEMSVVQSEEGTVFAQVCVDATGQAISLDITQTSGHERLDQATREYLFETVEYQPAIRDGEPVDYCRTELVLWFLEELQAERQAQIEADRERTGSVQQRDYPTESVRLREEGLVIVNVCVAADGSIDDVRLVETSGNPRLDNATIRMVMSRFRYNPATQQGAPVRHCQNQPVRWALPPQ